MFRFCDVGLVLLLRLLGLAATADALFTAAGNLTVLGSEVSGVFNDFVAAAGDGSFVTAYISTDNTVIVQDTRADISANSSLFTGIPFLVTTFNTTSTSVCLYCVNAAVFNVLQNTNFFADPSTCPSVAAAVGVSRRDDGRSGSGNQNWQAQCPGYVWTDYGDRCSWTCLTDVASTISPGRPLYYNASQFEPAVSFNVPQQSFYPMYFVVVALRDVPTSGFNLSITLNVRAQTAYSPPPPLPPKPPSPDSSALTHTPSAWACALALIACQLLLQLVHGSR